MFTARRHTSSAKLIAMTTEHGLSLAALSAYSPRRNDTTSSDDVRRFAVLIFSSDPLAAALIAAAIELAGHAPHFAQPGESAREALRRVRPGLVLIDCDHAESCSDEFIGPALMMKARVLLFKSKRTERDVREFAERLKLRVVSLPMEYEDFQATLQEAVTAG
jgi:hypothetical protein